MQKFNDIDKVREDLKYDMPLNVFIEIADKEYTRITGKKCDALEMVNDHLYKKRCDLDSHPIDDDGTRDSTPSFTVCPQKELWHCFGCGESGDRFEYISQKFNLSHIESIYKVAELQGFDLTSYLSDLSTEDKIRYNLYQLNNDARNLAHNALLDNDKALEYLYSRGITDESIDLYNIGYAPPLSNGTTIFENNINNAGTLLLNRKDQFNDAILFPINNVSGDMRYFQSRPFNTIPGMKYIGANDEHPLFDETDRVFGFDIARKNIHKSGGRLVGVEGAPDCIACMQHGIISCGFLGTAISQNTFDLLDRYRVTELILLLDGDKAGRQKSYKNAEKYLSLNTRVRLKIAIMPEGYDPEEYINTFGDEELKKCIDNAVYAVQYLIDSEWNNAKTPTEKIDFMSNISKYMILLQNDMIRQIMITHIAGKIGLDPIQIEDYYMKSAAEQDGSNLYAPDEEEILLGEAMRNPDFISELTMRFMDNDWYLLKHRHLYKILKSSEYTDIESVYTIAKNINVDQILTFEWIEYIYNKTGNIEFALKDVEDKLIRRKTLNIIDETKIKLNDMQHDVSLLIDSTTNNMFNVVHSKSNERIFDTNSQVNTAMNEIMYRMNNPIDIVGWSYGKQFEKLDKYTLGQQKGTLIVVAANQSVGKTQICENFAISQAVEQNANILWFSLEMDQKRMTYRNLAILSGISSRDMMRGNITVEQKAQVDQAAIKLMNSNLYISEKGHDLSEALAIARKYVVSKRVDIIYVDYLQLQYVTDKRQETRSRELGYMSKAWKEFAGDTNTTVVLISQLGRQALEADTAEAEHGYGSYEVAQDADVYITLKDKSDEEIEMRGIEHGNKTMNISKNRDGEKTVLLDIYSDGPTYRMMECD